MTALRLSVLIALITSVISSSAFAQRGQAYDLSLKHYPGLRWKYEWTAQTTIQTTEVSGMTISDSGFFADVGEAEITILDAANSKLNSVRVAYGKCETRVQRGNARPAAQPGLLSRKILTFRRSTDPTTGQDTFKMEGDAVLSPEQEQAMGQSLANSFMLRRPVTIGETWDSNDLEGIFGAGANGSARFRFRNVGRSASGRDVAYVEVQGSSSSTIGGSGAGYAQKLSLVISYEFSGMMVVDLKTGISESVVLEGRARLEHGALEGNTPTIQTGLFSYRTASNILPDARIERGPQNDQTNPTPNDNRGANPFGGGNDQQNAGPGPFAGTFKNDSITLTLTGSPARYTGTVSLNQQQFPVVARSEGNRLEGNFEANGQQFPFTASLEGNSLTFSTGGNNFTLQRQGGAPQGPNPGLGGKTNPFGG
jgi:hypothetical protein